MEVDVFAAIAAPVRRDILVMLAKRDMPVSQIADSFQMSLSAISQHLSILKDARLVVQSKVGRQRIYRLTPDPLSEVTKWLEENDKFWQSKLGRLETFLEEQS